MIRDSLEMVPVAVIMAVILFFGIRKTTTFEPAHAMSDHVFTTVSGFPTIPAMMVSSSSKETSTDVDRKTVVTASLVSSGNASSSGTPVFIERKTLITGVPFYTTADIPQSSSSLSRTRTATALSGTTTAATASTTTHSSDSRILINQADANALVKIPGIGPLKARLILEARPANGFQSWDEIDAIPGFGAGTISMMKLHARL